MDPEGMDYEEAYYQEKKGEDKKQIKLPNTVPKNFLAPSEFGGSDDEMEEAKESYSQTPVYFGCVMTQTHKSNFNEFKNKCIPSNLEANLGYNLVEEEKLDLSIRNN